jgi:hypothetical protein
VKFTQAWHAFIGDDGALVPHGGKRLTIGLAADGAVYLTGEALGGAEVRLTREVAARVAARLASFSGAAPAPAPDACPDCGRGDCTGEGCYWPDEAGIAERKLMGGLGALNKWSAEKVPVTGDKPAKGKRRP